jgi:hypothetical protein
MDESDEKQWDFVPIDKKYQRDSFDCGYPALNDYTLHGHNLMLGYWVWGVGYRVWGDLCF